MLDQHAQQQAILTERLREASTARDELATTKLKQDGSCHELTRRLEKTRTSKQELEGKLKVLEGKLSEKEALVVGLWVSGGRVCVPGF